jgi:hypothetical protein
MDTDALLLLLLPDAGLRDAAAGVQCVGEIDRLIFRRRPPSSSSARLPPQAK